MSLAKYHAKSLMKKCEPQALPINPYKIAEEIGILVREDDCEGYTGMLIVFGNQALISVKASIKEYSRKRFTVAHELGHFHIPGHITKEGGDFRCTDLDLNTFAKESNEESKANEFAAELLMPEDIFIEKIRLKDLSYNLLQNLMQEFETSLTATGIRFVELSKDYTVVCSENSKIKWFIKGENFPFFINAIGKLSENSIAIEHFKGEELPKSFELVPANAWLDDHRLKDDAEVQEFSIALPSYNQVLSFLYIQSYEENEENEYLEELNGYPKFKK